MKLENQMKLMRYGSCIAEGNGYAFGMIAALLFSLAILAVQPSNTPIKSLSIFMKKAS